MVADIQTDLPNVAAVIDRSSIDKCDAPLKDKSYNTMMLQQEKKRLNNDRDRLNKLIKEKGNPELITPIDSTMSSPKGKENVPDYNMKHAELLSQMEEVNQRKKQ